MFHFSSHLLKHIWLFEDIRYMKAISPLVLCPATEYELFTQHFPEIAVITTTPMVTNMQGLRQKHNVLLEYQFSAHLNIISIINIIYVSLGFMYDCLLLISLKCCWIFFIVGQLQLPYCYIFEVLQRTKCCARVL